MQSVSFMTAVAATLKCLGSEAPSSNALWKLLQPANKGHGTANIKEDLSNNLVLA